MPATGEPVAAACIIMVDSVWLRTQNADVLADRPPVPHSPPVGFAANAAHGAAGWLATNKE